MRQSSRHRSVSPASTRGRNARATERRQRYRPTAVLELADSLKRQGVDLASRAGPWRAVERPLLRPGRNQLGVLPIVTNGLAQVMVDTMEQASDLAGLLNMSGVDDLDPVPDLVPPVGLRYETGEEG